MQLGPHAARLNPLLLLPPQKSSLNTTALAPTAPESRREGPGTPQPPSPSPPHHALGSLLGRDGTREPPRPFLETPQSPQHPTATTEHGAATAVAPTPRPPRPGPCTLFCSPKPSAPQAGTHPDPCSPRTLSGTRAEVTAGHRSPLSCSLSQPLPTARAAAALPRSLGTPALGGSPGTGGTPGPPATTTTTYGSPACSATPTPSPAPPAPDPGHPQHPQTPGTPTTPPPPSPPHFSHGAAARPAERPCPRLPDARPGNPIPRPFPKHLGPSLPVHLPAATLLPDSQPRPTSTAARPTGTTLPTTSPCAWRRAGGRRRWGTVRRVPLEGPPGPPPLPLADPGLQMAPCSCCFDPRLFHILWTSSHLPPPAHTALDPSTVPLPAAALGGPGVPPSWAAPGTPQGRPHHRAPGRNQSAVVAPAPLLQPMSVPGDQDIVGQPAQNTIAGTATTVGAQPGRDIPPGSDVTPSPSA